MDPAPLQRMFQAARAEGITSLAAFLGLCLAYADHARREIRGHVQPVAATSPGPLLVTVKEAPAFLGPSFTTKKLYRILSTMPDGCVVRKGGRLYLHLPSVREWAAKQ